MAAAANNIPYPWRSSVSGASFNTSDGILTIQSTTTRDVTIDLDGRYALSTAGGSVPSGNIYEVPMYTANGTAITGSGILYVSGTTGSTAGKVGIQTNNPQAYLHINTDGTDIRLSHASDTGKYSEINNTSAGKLDISTVGNEVNVDGFNIADTLSAAVTSIRDSGDSQGSSDTALVTEGWINANIGEGTGSIADGAQYRFPYYSSAGTSNALSASAYLTTDASNNIILSGASNTFKTAVDMQSTVGVSGALTVSGAASFLEPVTIDNATGVGISATGTKS